MGTLTELARRDAQDIMSNQNDFGEEFILSTPDGATTITLAGIHVKIGIDVNTEGNVVNSKKSHIAFAEKILTDAGYPVRNSGGEVSINNHLVNVKDSTGVVKNYIIDECTPDEHLGILSCLLGDYQAV